MARRSNLLRRPQDEILRRRGLPFRKATGANPRRSFNGGVSMTENGAFRRPPSWNEQNVEDSAAMFLLLDLKSATWAARIRA
jgi:hypothetical protein